MKYCTQCSSPNDDKARFCGGCGAALQTTAPGFPPGFAERTLADDEPSEPRSGGLVAGPAAPGVVGNRSQYEVMEEIGRGGMSVVYRARDRKLHREVALKRLLPQFAQRERAVGRLMAEARSIANLIHPNIVGIYDINQDEDGPYIAMEYVSGTDGKPLTLAEKVQRSGPLPEKAAVELVAKLCQAVGFAHQKRIIHRDIKPTNILLTREGEPKLVDFGIAHAAEDTVGQTFSGLTMDGTTLGTLDYMSPEQEQNAKSADERADIYALGGVLNFCLTGYSARHFRESSVPAKIRAVLAKALDRDPRNRWQTTAEFARALEAAEGASDFAQMFQTAAQPILSAARELPSKLQSASVPIASALAQTTSPPTLSAGMKPHRGKLILTFGIVGFVCGGPLFAIPAWVMGTKDLKAMKAGYMDPSGSGLTTAGRVLGIICSCLWVVYLLIALIAGLSKL